MTRRTKSHIAVSLWICIGFLPTLTADDAQNPPTDARLADAAAEVYNRLFTAARANSQLSVADIESLNSWSTRIMVHQLSADGVGKSFDLLRFADGVLPLESDELGAATGEAIHSHAIRLKQVAGLAKHKSLSNAADKDAAAVVRYFDLLADSILERMDAIHAPVDTLLIPRTSALTGKSFVIFINAKSAVIVEKKASFNETTGGEIGDCFERDDRLVRCSESQWRRTPRPRGRSHGSGGRRWIRGRLKHGRIASDS